MLCSFNVHKGQKRVVDPLELELQDIASYLVGVLITKHGPVQEKQRLLPIERHLSNP